MTRPVDAILEATDVALAFGGAVALDKVSIDVRRGELLGLIGPNGSGKTSFCNVVSGLYVPSAGSVRFADQELVGKQPHQVAQLGVARTLQGVEMFGMTVLENALLGRHTHWHGGILRALARTRRGRRDRREQEMVADTAVDLLDLTPWSRDAASDLPYGVRKRVELARAVAMEPQILVLDEPTAGMSPSEKAEIAVLIRRLNRERGLSVLLVEHDVSFVRELVTWLVVLNNGQVLRQGETEEVLADERVIEAYVGRKHGGTDEREPASDISASSSQPS